MTVHAFMFANVFGRCVIGGCTGELAGVSIDIVNTITDPASWFTMLGVCLHWAWAQETFSSLPERLQPNCVPLSNHDALWAGGHCSAVSRGRSSGISDFNTWLSKFKKCIPHLTCLYRWTTESRLTSWASLTAWKLLFLKHFLTAYTQIPYLSHNFWNLTLKHQNHTSNLQNHTHIFGLWLFGFLFHKTLFAKHNTQFST